VLRLKIYYAIGNGEKKKEKKKNDSYTQRLKEMVMLKKKRWPAVERI